MLYDEETEELELIQREMGNLLQGIKQGDNISFVLWNYHSDGNMENAQEREQNQKWLVRWKMMAWTKTEIES